MCTEIMKAVLGTPAAMIFAIVELLQNTVFPRRLLGQEYSYQTAAGITKTKKVKSWMLEVVGMPLHVSLSPH